MGTNNSNPDDLYNLDTHEEETPVAVDPKILNEQDLLNAVRRLTEIVDNASKDDKFNIGDIIQLEEDLKDLSLAPNMDDVDFVLRLFQKLRRSTKL